MGKHKLTRIALIPTILSFGLTYGYHLLTIQYSPTTKTDWPAELRQLLIFGLASEFLLLLVSALIHLVSVEPNSPWRALTAEKESLKCLAMVEAAHDRCSPAHPFLRKRLSEYVTRFLDMLSPLQEGSYQCPVDQIANRTAELYELSAKVQAVSLIDVRSYWDNPTVGRTAIEQNLSGAERGLHIERILIFQRPEEVLACRRWLAQLQDAGVRLRYTCLNEIEEDCREDFSIYDDCLVQYFEFEEATFNKSYVRCTISNDERQLDKYKKIFQQLRGVSKPLNVHDFEVPAGDTQSLWYSKEFRAHYDSTAPELHLEKIAGRYKTVLDVGCGSGRILKLFADQGCDVTGIDSDTTAINMCRGHLQGKPATLLNEQFSADRLQGKIFDLIVAYNSIYHCRKDALMSDVQGMAGLLKHGGHLLLTLKTVNANQDAVKGGTQIETNTWIGCNMPDYWAIHHFCNDDELKEIASLVGEIVHQEKIPVIRKDQVIVQAAGVYLILRKGLQT